jgi:putative DNA methylase
MARALKPGAPLAFTYHHNKLEVYHSIGVAILDAGLTVLGNPAVPQKWAARSIFSEQARPIIDTIFVCRANGEAKRRHIFRTMDELIGIVRDELGQLRLAGVKLPQDKTGGAHHGFRPGT